MDQKPSAFNEHEVLHRLKHYLPAQAPLKDFIHHNTLHAFQHETFYQALQKASSIFGFKVFLELEQYQELYRKKQISQDILESVIKERKGPASIERWLKLLNNKTSAKPG